jgi:hypothetical protein
MEKTLAVLNQMEADGVIERYAIGGAIAATFYMEPAQTYDLDVFLVFPASTLGLITISPIYSYLMARGYQPEGEAINIEGWPVQFLPAFNPLIEEALESAAEVVYETTPTRVFTAEYLAAIMLYTGRAKDHARLVQLLTEGTVNHTALHDIIVQHDLGTKWESFKRRFLDTGVEKST